MVPKTATKSEGRVPPSRYQFVLDGLPLLLQSVDAVDIQEAELGGLEETGVDER